jgi:hypothetical protein
LPKVGFHVQQPDVHPTAESFMSIPHPQHRLVAGLLLEGLLVGVKQNKQLAPPEFQQVTESGRAKDWVMHEFPCILHCSEMSPTDNQLLGSDCG